MDLGVTDDWEFLSRDAAFLDDQPPLPPAAFPVVVGTGTGTGTADNMPLIMDMNYFICPSSPPPDPGLGLGRGGPRLLLPFRIDDQFEAYNKKKVPPDPNPDLRQGSFNSKQIIPKLPPIEIADNNNNSSCSRISVIKEKEEEVPNITEANDLDPVSHVFFKKMKETEFVDIKVELESPKCSSPSSIVLPLPQAQIVVVPPPPLLISDVNGVGDHRDMMRFEDKPQVEPSISEQENIVPTTSTCGKVADGGGASPGGSGFNTLWRWGVGVAATAVCILIFGPHPRRRRHHHHKNKNQSQLRIQFFTHHKGGGMKQVVQQAATLNGAISARVAGVPFTRACAHITFGGYYDAL